MSIGHNSNIDIASCACQIFIGDKAYNPRGLNEAVPDVSAENDIMFSKDNRQTFVKITKGYENSDTHTLTFTNPASTLLEALKAAYITKEMVRLVFRPIKAGVKRGETFSGVVAKHNFQKKIGDANGDNFEVVFKGLFEPFFYPEDDIISDFINTSF